MYFIEYPSLRTNSIFCFSLPSLNLEHEDLKLWVQCFLGHINWSQFPLDISTRMIQDTLSIRQASEFVVETASWASVISDSFGALIGYWTLRHANKHTQEQLLKGSIESLLSCWHIASVLRVFCGCLLLKETYCPRMTLRWNTCQTLHQLSLTLALSAEFLGTDFSVLMENRSNFWHTGHVSCALCESLCIVSESHIHVTHSKG